MGRCFHKVALAVLLAVTAGSTAQATGLGDYLDGTQSLSIADSRVMADLATYYRLHANVRLEPERRLKSGVVLYDDITVNPVILSYRELEPFMKPGPWRDELLAPSSSTPRPSTPRP
ncbi:MAG: hypothetical protein ACOY4R_29285 [Pseudomonadota bacterium]